MYEYLKDFSVFYDAYIRLHGDAVVGDINKNSNFDADESMIRDTHNIVSSTYIKIIEHYGGKVDYASLMYDDKYLFDEMSATVSRHFNGGVRLEYLISGTNLLNACLFDMTINADIGNADKIIMLDNLRKISGAYCVAAVGWWTQLEAKRSEEFINKRDGRLNLELERFSRYIDSRSSIIIFIDNSGRLLRANKAAKTYFAFKNDLRRYSIMDILDYHFLPFPVFIKKYSQKELKPVRLMNGEKFDMGISPIVFKDKRPCEYVITLKNTTRLKHDGGGG